MGPANSQTNKTCLLKRGRLQISQTHKASHKLPFFVTADSKVSIQSNRLCLCGFGLPSKQRTLRTLTSVAIRTVKRAPAANQISTSRADYKIMHMFHMTDQLVRNHTYCTPIRLHFSCPPDVNNDFFEGTWLAAQHSVSHLPRHLLKLHQLSMLLGS